MLNWTEGMAVQNGNNYVCLVEAHYLTHIIPYNNQVL
jgi:hypothetical protein